ncbi:hypothetical protein [Paraburkholderia sp. BCC1884]|uniref:hypothetical protein n=1 Tax=Paraburkholderia sp. BCC1884 TaxID=2562668 RepID=UPI0016431D05|nr:hypothetical protein [Paraburkholderia sp. BCC1884]
MSDTREAFRLVCADIGAVSALLGFDEYPGVDELLRAITNLIIRETGTVALTDEQIDAVWENTDSRGATLRETRIRFARNLLAAAPAYPADDSQAASDRRDEIEYAIQVLRQVEAGDGTFVGQCTEAISGLESLLAAPFPRASDAAQDLTRELLETLQLMVKHFTKTPSTLADSQARGKAHEVIAKAYASIGYSTAQPFADDTGATLTALDAYMVWPDDDGEQFFHSIDDAVESEVDSAWPVDVEPPANDELELKLQLAKRIQTATVRIFNITENGHEWEIVPATDTGVVKTGEAT